MEHTKENLYYLLFEALEDSRYFSGHFDGLAITNGRLMITLGDKDFVITATEEEGE
jgi:hypothetical protein